MQKISDPSQVEDLAIRSFFQQRFEQLEGDITDTEFILVDSGDSLESLESGTGCALFSCWDNRGQTTFNPSHNDCYVKCMCFSSLLIWHSFLLRFGSNYFVYV